MAKTTAQRVDDLRKRMETLGFKRRELYVHDDDWPLLRKQAAKLQRKRRKAAGIEVIET